MSTAQIKKTLQSYINEADETFLRAVYALMEYDREKSSFELSPSQKKMLDERKLRYKKGEGKSYIWEEVKQRAKSALAREV